MDFYREAKALCEDGMTRTKLNITAKMALLKAGKAGFLLRSCLGKVHQLLGAGY